jgi:hypothetical protein
MVRKEISYENVCRSRSQQKTWIIDIESWLNGYFEDELEEEEEDNAVAVEEEGDEEEGEEEDDGKEEEEDDDDDEERVDEEEEVRRLGLGEENKVVNWTRSSRSLRCNFLRFCLLSLPPSTNSRNKQTATETEATSQRAPHEREGDNNTDDVSTVLPAVKFSALARYGRPVVSSRPLSLLRSVAEWSTRDGTVDTPSC